METWGVTLVWEPRGEARRKLCMVLCCIDIYETWRTKEVGIGEVLK